MFQAPFTLSLGRSSLGLVFLALALCQPANAQEKPDAPKPKQTACCSSDICARQHHHALPEAPKPKPDSKVFWLGTALLAASQSADAITTRGVLDRGGAELNVMFGRHPSPAKQAGIDAALFAGQVIVFHFTEKSRKPLVRWLGRVGLGYQISDYARLAACNSQIGAGIQANPHQRCSPY